MELLVYARKRNESSSSAIAPPSALPANEKIALISVQSESRPNPWLAPNTKLLRRLTLRLAEVWKARSTSLEGFDKLIAIKRILPRFTGQKLHVHVFGRGSLALTLNHANVVQTFDIGVPTIPISSSWNGLMARSSGRYEGGRSTRLSHSKAASRYIIARPGG